jgi:hypothetical protein
MNWMSKDKFPDSVKMSEKVICDRFKSVQGEQPKEPAVVIKEADNSLLEQ